jgi:VIT1/CCC1 family predicted Fe2+/Mn2+ transporter
MAKQFDSKLLKAAVYGANDGIITTFAVVAGVAGAGLSPKIIIILGIANMMADAVSMGVGDYLGEKSQQRLLRREHQHYTFQGLWKTGLTTFLAFVAAGSLPLLPYILQNLGLPILDSSQFTLSIISTASALFFVGSLRTIVTSGIWWKNGLEMLGIGAIAATVAYFLGYYVDQLVS